MKLKNNLLSLATVSLTLPDLGLIQGQPIESTKFYQAEIVSKIFEFPKKSESKSKSNFGNQDLKIGDDSEHKVIQPPARVLDSNSPVKSYYIPKFKTFYDHCKINCRNNVCELDCTRDNVPIEFSKTSVELTLPPNVKVVQKNFPDVPVYYKENENVEGFNCKDADDLPAAQKDEMYYMESPDQSPVYDDCGEKLKQSDVDQGIFSENCPEDNNAYRSNDSELGPRGGFTPKACAPGSKCYSDSNAPRRNPMKDETNWYRNQIHESPYDKYGYDKNGLDRDGFDRQGFDKDGFDFDGYNRQGFDRDGFNRDGFDKAGYDCNGFDKYGYDKHGRDQNGYDAYGFDQQGFKADGYNMDGYNRDGFDKFGYDRAGYNKDGYFLGST